MGVIRETIELSLGVMELPQGKGFRMHPLCVTTVGKYTPHWRHEVTCTGYFTSNELHMDYWPTCTHTFFKNSYHKPCDEDPKPTWNKKVTKWTYRGGWMREAISGVGKGKWLQWYGMMTLFLIDMNHGKKLSFTIFGRVQKSVTPSP